MTEADDLSEPKLAPGQTRSEEAIVHGGTVRARPPIAPVTRTMAHRVGDAETEIMQQNAHILLLHQLIDQLVDQVTELRYELAMVEWKPQVHAEKDVP